MDKTKFEQMVARIERDSAASPRLYQFRVAMLALFGFGVLAVVLGMASMGILVLAGAALALALTGFKAAIVVLKLGKLLLVLAWPLWVLIKSSMSALFTRLPAPKGHEILRAQAPALFAAMDEMRRRMKGPRFHHVLITHEVNAAVMQRPLFGLIGWPRNYLILGLPLLESLSPEEALAVVAHEYGHLAGSHSRFGAYVYRLRSTWGTIQSLTEQWQGAASRPLQKLVGWYAPYFNAYTFVLARANEYQADAASAELVGAQVAASALKRVNLASASYERFMGAVFQGIGEQPQPPRDVALRWAEQAQDGAVGDADAAQSWLQVALDRRTDLADTHPALTQRLQALVSGEPRLTELPEPLGGTSAAQTWLGADLARLRDLVQQEWLQNVAKPWEERHKAIGAQRERLAELKAMSSLNADQELELIRLRIQLEPDMAEDHLAQLQDFNARHVDHALGLYVEATTRLGRDDEAGLAMLERVMALDATAAKPACEAAYAFLQRVGDGQRAQTYAERWRARDELERRQAQEMSQLSVHHPVANPAALTGDQRREAVRIVRKVGQGVKRAYIARRVMPSAPPESSYVVMLELTWMARLRRQHAAIVQRFAREPWPMHVVLCTAHSTYAPLKAKLTELPDARLL